MTINYSIIFAYIIGIVLLLLLGRVFLLPMKVALKLVYNAVLGGLALIAVNFAGGLIGLHIAFNVVTAFTAGILGFPGLVLLIVLKYFTNQ